MKNIENYKKELKRLGNDFAMKKTNNSVSCDEIECEDCLFYDGCFDCNIYRWRWLFEECKETIKEPILDNIEKEYYKKDDWSWVINNEQVLHMNEETKKAYFKHLGIEGDESK